MMDRPLFHDRYDAGVQLADVVAHEIAKLALIGDIKPIVYALPKGGVPIAAPIAQRLHCPLDIVIAKKVTRPDNPELAIGAVSAAGHVIRSRQEGFTFYAAGLWRAALKQAQAKAQEQSGQFTAQGLHLSAAGAIAILVDDGIATGMTIAVAARALRAQHPSQVWICAPVAPLSLLKPLSYWGDRVIVLHAPEVFLSVSRFYEQFPQVEMEEALECLSQSREQVGSGEC